MLGASLRDGGVGDEMEPPSPPSTRVVKTFAIRELLRRLRLVQASSKVNAVGGEYRRKEEKKKEKPPPSSLAAGGNNTLGVEKAEKKIKRRESDNAGDDVGHREIRDVGASWVGVRWRRSSSVMHVHKHRY